MPENPDQIIRGGEVIFSQQDQEEQFPPRGGNEVDHEAEVRTDPSDVSFTPDAHSASESTDLAPISPVGMMIPSGLVTRVRAVLEKPPQSLPSSHCMVGTNNQTEDRTIHQKLDRILHHLEALTKHHAPSMVQTPATPSEVMSAGDDPEPSVAKPHSTASDTKRKWKHCPPLLPYIEEATLQSPISDLDIQRAILADTGYAPSPPTIRKHIWRLAEEGKVEIYARDRDGNMTPYPARRTTLKPFVTRKGETPAAPNPLSSDSQEAGGADGHTVGSVSPSSSATDDGAKSASQVPPPSRVFPRLLRQLGLRRGGNPIGG